MGTMKGKQAATSIYLLPEVLLAVQTLSKRTRIPMAALLREAVDDLLEKHGESVAIRRRKPGQTRAVSTVTKMNTKPVKPK